MGRRGRDERVAERITSVPHARDLAARRVPAPVRGYVEGGAGHERTLEANLAAVRSVRFRPQVGTPPGVPPDLSTTVLGTPVALPVLLGPVGFTRMMHPDGDVGGAAGGRRRGHDLHPQLHVRTHHGGGAGRRRPGLVPALLPGRPRGRRPTGGPGPGPRLRGPGRDPRHGHPRGPAAREPLPAVPTAAARPGDRGQDGSPRGAAPPVADRRGPRRVRPRPGQRPGPHPRRHPRHRPGGPHPLDGRTGDLDRRRVDRRPLRRSGGGQGDHDGGRRPSGGRGRCRRPRRLQPRRPAARRRTGHLRRARGGRRRRRRRGRGPGRRGDPQWRRRRPCRGARRPCGARGPAWAYGLCAAGRPGVDRILALLRQDVDRTVRLLGVSSIGDVDRTFVDTPAEWPR